MSDEDNKRGGTLALDADELGITPKRRGEREADFPKWEQEDPWAAPRARRDMWAEDRTWSRDEKPAEQPTSGTMRVDEELGMRPRQPSNTANVDEALREDQLEFEENAYDALRPRQRGDNSDHSGSFRLGYQERSAAQPEKRQAAGEELSLSSTQSARILTWLAQPGERVHAGAPLAEYICAGESRSLTAPAPGRLTRVIFPERAPVPRATAVAIFQREPARASPPTIALDHLHPARPARKTKPAGPVSPPTIALDRLESNRFSGRKPSREERKAAFQAFINQLPDEPLEEIGATVAFDAGAPATIQATLIAFTPMHAPIVSVVEGDRFLIGSGEGSDFRISDKSVGEAHARIERHDGRYYIVDLDSGHRGTLLGNGIALQGGWVELGHQTVFAIGLTILRFVEGPAQDRDFIIPDFKP